MTSQWAEANGGMRGSTYLRAGAIVYFLAALLHFTARLLVPGADGPDHHYFLVALVVWDLALFLLAAGFFWTGVHSFLSRFGIVLGLFILGQAAYLMLSLTTRNTYPVPPSVLTLGRTLLLALFAFIERDYIGRKVAAVLGIVSGLHFLQVFLRSMGLWQPLEQPWQAALSALFMVITAGAIYAAGIAVRRHEEIWARAQVPDRMARFNNFNNPHHRRKAKKEKSAEA